MKINMFIACSPITRTSNVQPRQYNTLFIIICWHVPYSKLNLILSYFISSHLISSHLISSHFTSPHLTSHLISPHLISSHLTSSHLTSSHLSSRLTSHHLISPHLISPHLTSPHLISPHLLSSYNGQCLPFPTRIVILVNTKVNSLIYAAYFLTIRQKQITTNKYGTS